MHLDFDTSLTLLYYHTDSLYKRFFTPSPSSFSDSEVISVFLLMQFYPFRSEARFLSLYHSRLLPYFPKLLSQSAFNKRARKLRHRIAFISVHFHLFDNKKQQPYEIMDGLPVPVMKTCRGIKTNLFSSEVDYGKGGPEKKYYYGVKMQSMINLDGYITGFVVGPASTNELYLAESIFRWRRWPEADAPSGVDMEDFIGKTHHNLRKGPNGGIASDGVGTETSLVCIADLGMKGKKWQEHWEKEYGFKVITPEEAKHDGTYRRLLSGERQKIETGFGRIVDEMWIRYPKARSYEGLLARIAGKVAAFNFTILLNRVFAENRLDKIHEEYKTCRMNILEKAIA